MLGDGDVDDVAMMITKLTHWGQEATGTSSRLSSALLSLSLWLQTPGPAPALAQAALALAPARHQPGLWAAQADTGSHGARARDLVAQEKYNI